MFEVIRVDASYLDNLEQLGTKPKFWFDDFRFLFKARRENTGEDWAEVVSGRLAAQMGLPHAHYELAEAVGLAAFDMVRGVRSTNFTPEGGRLILGNELIGSVASGETGSGYTHRRQFHTPSRLAALMSVRAIRTPMNWTLPVPHMTAIGVVAGYLMLDVLIGNQDRHEENWGLINFDRAIYLAPTFDHASSLGRNETDARRASKLATVDHRHGIPGFAAKAMSQLFGRDGRKLSTLEAFEAFAQHCRPQAAFWQVQVRRMTEVMFRLMLNEVPDSHISDVGREFAVGLLNENRRRLLALEL